MRLVANIIILTMIASVLALGRGAPLTMIVSSLVPGHAKQQGN
jgi:hypothetical protein